MKSEKMCYDLENDLFIIPSTSEKRFIVYFPLKKSVFYVDVEYKEILENWMNGNIKIEELPQDLVENLVYISQKETSKLKNSETSNGTLIIIPTQVCNLNCSYCYARNAHAMEYIDVANAKKMIEKVANSNAKRKSISFIGGGEPFLAWEQLKELVNYTELLDPNIVVGVTTNGTLLDKEKLDWVQAHKININLSFDVLPDVQQLQRPFKDNKYNSFEVVDTVISELLERNVVPSIRSTITQNNVNRMLEMIQYIVENYPGLKRVHFEHVSDIGMVNDQYFDQFLHNFFKAYSYAEEKNIQLKNSITNSVKYIKKRFCSGELCITPAGDCVSCHRVSSQKDGLFELFHFGEIRKIVENGMPKVVFQQQMEHKTNCEKCFAQYHCAGGCAYNRCLYSEEQYKSICDFTRNMIKYELERVAVM